MQMIFEDTESHHDHNQSIFLMKSLNSSLVSFLLNFNCTPKSTFWSHRKLIIPPFFFSSFTPICSFVSFIGLTTSE